MIIGGVFSAQCPLREFKNNRLIVYLFMGNASILFPVTNLFTDIDHGFVAMYLILLPIMHS